jgi:hypothetical protein
MAKRDMTCEEHHTAHPAIDDFNQLKFNYIWKSWTGWGKRVLPPSEVFLRDYANNIKTPDHAWKYLSKRSGNCPIINTSGGSEVISCATLYEQAGWLQAHTLASVIFKVPYAVSACLMLQESALHPRVRSPTGARGLGQFLPPGLKEVNQQNAKTFAEFVRDQNTGQPTDPRKPNYSLMWTNYIHGALCSTLLGSRYTPIDIQFKTRYCAGGAPQIPTDQQMLTNPWVAIGLKSLYLRILQEQYIGPRLVDWQKRKGLVHVDALEYYMLMVSAYNVGVTTLLNQIDRGIESRKLPTGRGHASGPSIMLPTGRGHASGPSMLEFLDLPSQPSPAPFAILEGWEKQISLGGANGSEHANHVAMLRECVRRQDETTADTEKPFCMLPRVFDGGSINAYREQGIIDPRVCLNVQSGRWVEAKRFVRECAPQRW